MQTTHQPVLIVHGGAGVLPGHDYSAPAVFLGELLLSAAADLADGCSALELVVEAVAAMEASGLFVAGKGASANSVGEVELDASVMTGEDRAAGAVAAVRNVVHPIRLAAAVRAEGRQVMLAGRGAEAFADRVGLDRVTDPTVYYRAATELTRTEADGRDAEHRPGAHGTVGAVALDLNARLAAATSTGGLLHKPQGRIGDSPIIGAGTWADRRVAVSATGHGEPFVRAAAAHDVAARMAYLGQDVGTATQAVLDEVKALGGNGGLIAVDALGNLAMPFNSGGMKRGYVRVDGEPVVEVY